MSQPLDAPDPDATQVPFSQTVIFGLREGLRVFNRYRLESLAGRGAIGEVWRARDEELDEPVALKFLSDAIARDPVAIDELKIETRRARQLTHPNIVRIHDFMRDDRMAAVSMEFVDGTTLAQQRLAQPGKVFSCEALASLVVQLAAALDYAHGEAKIVHRDLKPANLLVTREGRLKIADFGISRSMSETNTRLTGRIGQATSGTLLYMSPQQLLNHPPRATDDIYALGATLYELLASKPPFSGGDLLTLIRTMPPPSLAERRKKLSVSGNPIPNAWQETIAACLAKEPGDRPSSAAEVVRGLEIGPTADSSRGTMRKKVAAGPAPSPLKISEDEEDVQPERAAIKPRSMRLWWAMGACLVGILGLVVLAFVVWPRSKPDAVAAAKPVRKETALPAATSPAASGKEAVAAVPASPAAAPAVVPAVTLAPAPAPAPVPAALPREFTVMVDPPDVGAKVRFGSQAEAAVAADGRALVKDLRDGEHELIVQAPGFQTFTTRVSVKDGRGTAEARLVPSRGAVEIAARPGTLVTTVDARGNETRVGTVPPGGTLILDNQLTVGRYTFKLTHPDTGPVEVRAVEVVSGRGAKVAPLQIGLPGELQVISEPAGAEVSVNGNIVGRTPATVLNQPSETPLQVQISRQGYRAVAPQTVSLKPKETRTLNLGVLVAERGTMDLRVADIGLRNDVRLAVRLDGKPFAVERVNALLRLDALEIGDRVLEITHPDYELWTQRVSVRDQQSSTVDVKLVPKPATLVVNVSGPASYALRINGRPATLTDGRTTVPALEDLALEITATGYKPASRRLTLPINGSETWTVALEKMALAGSVAPVTVAKPAAQASDPARPWTVPELRLVMQPIAAGTFAMGSPANEPGHAEDEGPQTRVTIAQSFWLGKVEVTQREWTAIMGNNPSQIKGDDRPVENVTWDEAMSFCRKLTERERAANRLPEGHRYALPTEAQWEYACRAGTTGEYAGNIETMAWYSTNSGQRTQPVGRKKPNAWGLYDMHGNVWEWCGDAYTEKLPGGNVRDYTGPVSNPLRSYRGGSWDVTARNCRSANRSGISPGFHSNGVGFRLALVPLRADGSK